VARIKLDKVVVIDVESTCWEKNEERPRGAMSEIIEVGVCLLDVRTLERSDKASIIVRPLSSKVSPYCTELTGHTQAAVDAGISFPEAMNVLTNKYQIDRRGWASYGDYDRQMFMRDSQACGITYPFSLRHRNVKNQVSTDLGWEKEVGMDEALKRLGMSLDGRHHNGADDAMNIAKILAELMRRTRR
jgi:inhibitor of KinA sporulation pathway (predicted exonuclease)